MNLAPGRIVRVLCHLAAGGATSQNDVVDHLVYLLVQMYVQIPYACICKFLQPAALAMLQVTAAHRKQAAPVGEGRHKGEAVLCGGPLLVLSGWERRKTQMVATARAIRRGRRVLILWTFWSTAPLGASLGVDQSGRGLPFITHSLTPPSISAFVPSFVHVCVPSLFGLLSFLEPATTVRMNSASLHVVELCILLVQHSATAKLVRYSPV